MRTRTIAPACILLALVGGLHSMPAPGAITVCSEGCDFTSIQQAVDAAEPGDTILLGPETFYENVVVWKDLALRGSGAERTVVDGGRESRRVFESLLADLTLQDMSIQHGNGGVAVWGGSLSLVGCDVRDNALRGGQAGGGLLAGVSSSVDVIESTIRRNSVEWQGAIEWLGGGIALFDVARATISDSTIADNSAPDGGGVFAARGLLIVRNTSVVHNRHGYGAIHLRGARFRIESSTIAHNSRSGITAEWADGVILNTTIVSNHPYGIRSGGATLRVGGSLIAMHVDSDCDGDPGNLQSLGHNLTDDMSCGFEQPGDQPGTDPMLGPLQDNGGPTWTYVPLEGSPLIDRGSCQTPVDQRGVPRPVDGNLDGVWLCDIGAVEYVPYCDEPDRPCDDRKYEMLGPLGLPAAQ